MRLRIASAFGGTLLAAALLMTGCGASAVDTTTDGNGDGSPTSTVTIPVGTPGKGATPVTNVTITTDRGNYAPTDAIQASASNRSGKTIFVSDGKASCTIFELQVKTGAGWQAASVAPCTRASQNNHPIQMAAGSTHSATITARDGTTFPAGTYRLALSFSSFTIPPPVAAA